VRAALGHDGAEEGMRDGRELPRPDGLARLAAFAGAGRSTGVTLTSPATRP
jgi:hypothetical protein